MKLDRLNKNLLLVSFLVAALLPYFIICFHALPFADDFGYAWAATKKIPFTQKFLKHYFGWSGRFSANVLITFHPLVTGKILAYQLPLFFGMLATPVVLYIFLKQVIKDKATAIFSALYITLFYLSYLPNLTEGVYWHTGIAHYLVGNLLLLLQFALLLYLIKKERRSILLEITSYLLLIISVGFNEIAALLIPIFYLSITLFALLLKKNSKIFIAHTILAIIASSFALLAPGNFARAGEFADRGQFLHSVFYAGLQTIRFIGVWSLNYPFIALSLMIIANAEKVPDSFVTKTDYRIPAIGLLISVFTASFIPYLSTGILGQHRTLNYVFFFFILLWLWFLISASNHFNVYQKLNFFRKKFVISVVLLSSIIILIVSKESNLLRNLASNHFNIYKKEFMERQKKIIQNTSANIPPMSFIPSTFKIVDVKGDSTFFADKCLRRFYSETKIELE